MPPKPKKSGGGNVRVVCRFRPQNKREKKEKGKVCIKVSDGITVDLRMDDNEHSEATRFNFDRVFDIDSSQEEVYKYSASTLVQDALEGYNCTIFAYGQTGSGKTHSMMGELDQDHMRGIIPRIVEDIFVAIEDSPPDVEFTVKVAYVEIYMEKLRDLIDPSATNLRVREDKGRGVYVAGVTECYTGCPEEMLEIMERGASNRAVSYTAMNADSSRSHSLFIITIGQQDLKGKKSGQLFLVDLAGSEMIGKTGATGQTLKEAQTINKSLSALGNVIKALVEQSNHVPYRDSKLTYVLQDSLGGNSKTSLIITASCSSFNAIESLSTLRFGDRAKSIQNKAKKNVEMSVEEYKALLTKADKKVQQQIGTPTHHTLFTHSPYTIYPLTIHYTPTLPFPPTIDPCRPTHYRPM
jgi:kinesin family protein 5